MFTVQSISQNLWYTLHMKYVYSWLYTQHFYVLYRYILQGALSREHGVSNTNRSNPINYFCTQHWCCRPQGGLSRWYDVSLFLQSIFYADRRALNGKLWTIKGSHRLVWRTSPRISCSMHSSARKARELSEDYVLFQERKYEHLWSPTQEWISSSDPCCMESKPLDLLTSVKARKLWM